jgi:hypothetical protein
MKIKIGEFKVDTSTLIRLEWRKYYPKLIVHEKFEKKIKWILRILFLLGIILGFVAFDPIVGTIITLALTAVEQFLENTLFEYTTFVVQPFPDFEIDYSQWKTNGFAFTKVKDPKYPPIFGPAYKDEEYARKFFTYLKSWNNNEGEDRDNRIVISFVKEKDETYTTYLYANPQRKNLSEMFDLVEESEQVAKYGKQQQRLVMQMIFWNNLPFKEEYMINQFWKHQSNKEPFIFAPFVLLENGGTKMINDLNVLKYEYKIKNRNELTAADTEYHFK